MSWHLAAKNPGFCVANLRSSAATTCDRRLESVLFDSQSAQPGTEQRLPGALDLFMNWHLAAKNPGFCVANLRSSAATTCDRRLESVLFDSQSAQPGTEQRLPGALDLFMNWHLAAKNPGFCVANLFAFDHGHARRHLESVSFRLQSTASGMHKRLPGALLVHFFLPCRYPCGRGTMNSGVPYDYRVLPPD